ncbi:type I glyceraldehyde-3-phosphate dehydrogenase [Ketobacter alkanivorans]|uniref:Glyceraldehyde-3-phosphate dehydrogenase n=1 Tax=Ketobacter alkanivorans TaxID=1917421 RepID=A0A2K9LME0_9GAMM|nr:type I glyceraldehyde-3-phosphate dehydrogenase [Ketobacter alkanivorans]AUM13311.1 type I glyceraldehyde-3-phosphate dehydrogenase [Ketobacter alkanivorans]MCP5016764.1 type I glyceraldehyde-3-phosphate dehydrogenase [Ketobacter sp.]
MPIRVAINGYGRIGRNMLRALYENLQQGCNRHVRLVAINDLGSPESLLHLTRYDTTHGRFNTPVTLVQDDVLQVNGDSIKLLQIEDPAQCPWAALDVDVVLECTGIYRSREDASRHLQAGAKRVIIGAVAFDEVDATIVYGVNHHWLQQQHKVISNASCTTHCIAPLLQVMDAAFGVKQTFMTEIHSYTSDQVLLDHVHRDLRRARAGAQNLIPTTSSSIGAVQKVLPQLEGKISGYSMRVPTLNVAAVDLTLMLDKPVADVQQIHAAMKQASEGALNGILGYCHEPLVSVDFLHRTESAIYDETQTIVTEGMIKIVAWYDNETGYAHRLLDLVECLK